jgi:hypothetical protein
MAFYTLVGQTASKQPGSLDDDLSLLRVSRAWGAGQAMPPQDLCQAIVQAAVGSAAEGPSFFPSSLMGQRITDEGGRGDHSAAIGQAFNFIQKMFDDQRKKMEDQQREMDEQRKRDAAEIARLKAQIAGNQLSSFPSISSASISESVSSSASSFEASSEAPKKNREEQEAVGGAVPLEGASSLNPEVLTSYKSKKRKGRDGSSNRDSSPSSPGQLGKYKLSKLS